MSELYNIYRKSNIELARTVVFKSRIAELSNFWYYRQLGWTLPEDEALNIYYMHLNGEYCEFDTAMTLTSIDTRQSMTLTKAVLDDHPLTYADLKQRGDTFDRLVSTYPGQQDLIEGIIWPVEMDTILNAGDLEILRYDSTMIGDQEVSLIQDLQTWLYSLKSRWNNDSFQISESLFSHSWHSVVYGMMPAVIGSIREKYNNTDQASDWHIMMRLASNYNMDDFFYYLTYHQKIWLYRNIQAIRYTRGSNENLHNLVNKILTPVNLEAMQFSMVLRSTSLKSDKRYDYVFNQSEYGDSSVDVDAISALDSGGILDLTLDRAVFNRDDIDADKGILEHRLKMSQPDDARIPYIQASQIRQALSRFSDPYDERIRYWAYMATSGRYNGSVSVSIPLKETRNLKPLEALILMHYSIYRAQGLDVTNIQAVDLFEVVLPDAPTEEYLRSKLDATYVNVDPVVSEILEHWPTISDSIGTVNDLITLTAEVMEFRLMLWLQFRHGYDALGKQMIKNLHWDMMDHGPFRTAAPDSTYEEWISEMSLDVADMTSDQYLELADNCVLAVTGLTADDNNLTESQRISIKIVDRLTSCELKMLEGYAYAGAAEMDWPWSSNSFYHTDLTYETKLANVAPSMVCQTTDVNINGKLAFEVVSKDYSRTLICNKTSSTSQSLLLDTNIVSTGKMANNTVFKTEVTVTNP